MKLFRYRYQIISSSDDHLWGNWERSGIASWKVVAGTCLTVIVFAGMALHYRSTAREASFKRLTSYFPPQEAVNESDGTTPKTETKTSPTPSAIPDQATLPPEIQADIDAFLADATNLSRSARSVRPLEISSLSGNTDETFSISATREPREISLAEIFPAAETSLEPGAAQESNPTPSLESPNLDLNAPRDGGYQIVPIRAISTRRMDGSEAAVGPKNRSQHGLAPPSLPSPPPYDEGHASGLIRAVPVSQDELDLIPLPNSLQPPVRKPVSTPSRNLRVIQPTLKKPILGRASQTATVNVRFGDEIQRFTVKAYHPQASSQPGDPPLEPLVYQSGPVRCTPWIVQPGQSLESLAAALKVMPGEILHVNQISEVVVGQQIYLPIHQEEVRQY